MRRPLFKRPMQHLPVWKPFPAPGIVGVVVIVGLLALSFTVVITVDAIGAHGKPPDTTPGKTRAEYEAQWKPLVQKGELKEARTLCSGWLEAKGTLERTEAHKCLANVVYMEAGRGVKLEGDDAGGGVIRPGVEWKAEDEAIEHLNKAASLSPGDISIHLGRIALLRYSGRYHDIAGYLDKSVRAYAPYGGKSEAALEDWLGTLYPLFEARQFKASLAAHKVLEKHFPKSHKVIANIGAMLTMLERDDEAIVYVKRAVEMDPTDPINTWNLGRLYDFTGKTELADKYYSKYMTLSGADSEAQRKVNACTYAEFIETKLKDRKRACKMQKKYCPKVRQTGCG